MRNSQSAPAPRASSRGGRANKVTKPKQRTSRPSSVSQDAVDQLAVAAAAHAEQQQQHQLQQLQQHQHQHHDPDEVDAPHDAPTQTHVDIHHPHSSPPDDQHAQQQHQLAGLIPNGQDPSIHPALQALGQSHIHSQFATMDQQAMDAQMQETAAAAAAASAPAKTAAQMVLDSGYDKVEFEAAASALSKRLMQQPGRRLAKQRRAEQHLNLQRRSNVEALLAHVSGQKAASACKNCHKGHGPWTECVVVDGQMCGSCANCWYNASGARCSFHETNNPQAHQPAILPAGAAAANTGFGLPVLAPAGGMPMHPGMPIHDPQIPFYESEAKNVAERAMAEVRDLPNRKARLTLKVEVLAKQMMLAMMELEEQNQAEAAQAARRPMGSQANIPMPDPGSQVPDAAMEEAPGEEDGT